ncbi:3-phosphoshikimate 1-carboxyvinyltransferase [Clostridia bacterium]|nr:3-phosphoshikimate 1-carboxyvinyltransferase [Clostridia bacterium]
MTKKIYPGKLSGTISAPLSKSSAQRLLICSRLAHSAEKKTKNFGTGCVVLPDKDLLSEDIKSLISCLNEPVNEAETVFHCGESGANLRFLMPVAASGIVPARRITFTGGGRLPERPVGELAAVMKEHGVTFDFSAAPVGKSLPFTLSGKLTPGRYELSGDISSQYITGLLFALPLLGDGSEIVLTAPLQSCPYVEMTLDALSMFGVDVVFTEDMRKFSVRGKQRYICPESTASYFGKSGNTGIGIRPEGDWSGAAFFLAAGAINSHVSVSGLDINSLQGDKRILTILKDFGAKTDWTKTLPGNGTASISARGTAPIEIDVSEIPDLAPVLAVVAGADAGAVTNSSPKHVSTFWGAKRLRLKETDRLETTAALINSLGGKAEIAGHSLKVTTRKLHGGECESFGDHRIAMSAAIAALSCSEPVILKGAEAVNKSYPGFWNDFRALGGRWEDV